MEPKGLVANIQRYSLHDGGGIRTVAFLKGCPFRCPWCCNPENLSYEPEESLKESLCIYCSRKKGEACPRVARECPTGAKELVGTWYTAQELFDICKRDRIFYEESGGGVTLSGGEALSPCYQSFAVEFFGLAKEAGINTAVETTLSVRLTDVAALACVVDSWLVDFKVADEEESRAVCGVSPALRDENLRTLLAMGANVVARMPIIPGYTDTRENVEANIARVKELGIRRADVLPFHQLGEAKYASVGRAYEMHDVGQLSEKDVLWIVEALEAASVEATVHGE